MIQPRKPRIPDVEHSSAIFKQTLDSLAEHIAIIDAEGTIIYVNSSWRKFSDTNQGKCNATCEGINYFSVCSNATGPTSLEASSAMNGLEDILSGKINEFKIEYPCHSQKEKRWFILYITPLTSRHQITGAVVSHIPITDRKIAEDQLKQSENRFFLAFENASIGMALVSTDGSFLKVNKALCEFLGYTAESLLNITFQQITHPEDIAADLDHVKSILSGNVESYKMEKRYIKHDGSSVWAHLSVSLVRDETGEPLHFISQIEDIDERKRLEDELLQQATTDPLTNVHNRRKLIEKLSDAFSLYNRYKIPVTIAMLDIDHFKSINDNYGHITGDALLRHFTDIIKGNLRDSDFIGRYGGEEFIVCLPNTDHDQAETIFKRLLSTTRDSAFMHNNNSVAFTVSIGGSIFQESDTGIWEAIARADKAVYTAKTAGRDRHAFLL